MNLFERLKEWLDRLLGRDLWLVEHCDEPPDEPRPRRVYLVGEDGSHWAAAFVCPCGCKETIQLSLMRNDDPSWIAWGIPGAKASLHPSIWRVRGCRSHFFIKEGKVVWAKEARPDRRLPANY